MDEQVLQVGNAAVIEPNYVSVLQSIDDSLNSIESHLTQFASVEYQPYNDSTVIRKLGAIADGLEDVAIDGTVDYSGSIRHIAELVSYMDLMLVVVIVLLVLAMGLFAGAVVTRWMRSR